MAAQAPVAPNPRSIRLVFYLQQQGALIALVIIVAFGLLRYGENFRVITGVRKLVRATGIETN